MTKERCAFIALLNDAQIQAEKNRKGRETQELGRGESMDLI